MQNKTEHRKRLRRSVSFDVSPRKTMSYDLYFWRENVPTGKEPSATLGLLETEKPIDGIAMFNRKDVISAFKKRFADIEAGDVDVIWEGADSYFQVGFYHTAPEEVSCFYISCGWKLLESPDVMNRIIDTGADLGCGLYDPQENQRFEQPNKAG